MQTEDFVPHVATLPSPPLAAARQFLSPSLSQSWICRLRHTFFPSVLGQAVLIKDSVTTLYYYLLFN